MLIAGLTLMFLGILLAVKVSMPAALLLVGFVLVVWALILGETIVIK